MTEAPKVYSDISLNIHLELINLPEHLDRLQIVTSSGNNGILFSESERWAAPLQDNLMRVVRENLALIIPGGVISVGPWESSGSNAVKIELVFNHFSGQLGDHTQIDIRWRVSNNLGQTIQGHFTERQPIGDDYRDLIVGLNKGIYNFSLELAKEIAEK
jgi:uncharacterized lipoprotein YmbA